MSDLPALTTSKSHKLARVDVGRNPTWTRDELILALDVYFQIDIHKTSATSPVVIQLSSLLNELPVHLPSFRNRKFRNPDGVHMKLRNFARFDPSYLGKGLGRGGHLEQVVWGEFASDVTKLHCTAQAIKEGYRLLTDNVTEDELAEEEFPEGRILTLLHKQRERNQTLVRRKRHEVFFRTGRLACEVCGFDFCAVYGALGEGFAECHHTTPLSKLTSSNKLSRTADLAIVCANCHRMLHRSRMWIRVGALKSLVEDSARKLRDIPQRGGLPNLS